MQVSNILSLVIQVIKRKTEQKFKKRGKDREAQEYLALK